LQVLAQVARLPRKERLGRNPLRRRKASEKNEVLIRQWNRDRTHIETIPRPRTAAKLPLSSFIIRPSSFFLHPFLKKCSSAGRLENAELSKVQIAPLKNLTRRGNAAFPPVHTQKGNACYEVGQA
jgi:hypothetical protein